MFLAIIVYISLRSLNIIPQLLTFESWWWYNNLIFYTPVYIIGAYIGIYYPDILLKREYNSKVYTYVGLFLLSLVFLLWNFLVSNIHFLNLVYSIIDLIAIWFILKPQFCGRKIPNLLNCGFYIYALHNPILIPITSKIIELLMRSQTVFGIEAVFIKVVQIISVIFIAAIAKKVADKILPSKVSYYLTGGR